SCLLFSLFLFFRPPPLPLFPYTTLFRSPHRLGRCPIAVLPYRPSSESPLGRSRVTQAVMSITDRAVRSLLRMEVSAEFNSSPQRDRKSTRLNSSHVSTSYAVFCLKEKKN